MFGRAEAEVAGERRSHSDSPLRCSRREVIGGALLAAAAFVSRGVLRTRTAAASGAIPPAFGTSTVNQGWLFGGPYAQGAEATGYSDSSFANVTLPHTVTPLSWGDWNPSTWENLWIYRRHLSFSPTTGERVFLDFHAVMTNATVFLNGTQIGQHQGGYLPFSVELTDDLVAGDNVVAVIVDGRWLDVPPEGNPSGDASVDFLQPAGIVRDVVLRVVPDVFVSTIFAQATNVLTSPGLTVQATINAGIVPKGPVGIEVALYDGSTQVAEGSTSLEIGQVGQSTATVDISGLQNIALWSPESPSLYWVSVTAVAEGVSHTLGVTTGFREAQFQNSGFYLNGQRVEIFGLNRHGLFPYLGMGAPERLQRRDVELIKNELGCNMVRCSHYPQSPAFLDACDELGLLVWEEAPGWQYVGDSAFQELVVENVQDMIVRDRNRPSVIVWGTRLNEAGANPALWDETRGLAATLDGTRQTTGAMATQSTQNWAQDVFAYNDYHSSGDNAALLPPVSDVAYIVSEAVGAMDGAPLYRWVDSDSTLALQARMHAQVHGIAQADQSYAGLLAWAGIDYASLNGGGRIWHAIKWAGVLDTFRVAKFGAGFYASQVDPSTPVIAPAFFWDFGPSSPANGPGQGAMICTNCEQLELYLNGQYFATVTPDTQDFGAVAHPPVLVDLTVDGTTLPELRIDGYVGGQVVTSLKMSSNPTQDQLGLVLDDSSIYGDGSDATRFTIRSLDAYGNQRPYVQGDVVLSLSGPATLVSDNPFPLGELGGVGGGFIVSQPGASGTVTLTAVHPTLGQASAQLTVQPSANTASAIPMPPPSPPPVAVEAPTQPKAPSVRSEVKAALAALLAPRHGEPKIKTLLQHGGYTLHFQAPVAGTLSVQWDHTVSRGHHHHEKVLIAHAHATAHHPGSVKVHVKLTGQGRTLLEHARRERVTIDASFKTHGHGTFRSSRTVELRR